MNAEYYRDVHLDILKTTFSFFEGHYRVSVLSIIWALFVVGSEKNTHAWLNGYFCLHP